MSDVGDLLELLHGARDRWATLQCTARHWHHVERGQIAAERWASASRGTQMYARFQGGSQPETYERSERLWIAKPELFRIESDHRMQVTRGDTWWSRSEDGITTNDGDPQMRASDPLHEYAAHLDPAVLIPQLTFETVNGPVVRARTRANDQFGPGLLLGGGDRHVLTVDERGVVLRIESFIDGEPFRSSELTDVVWDAEIPEDVFRLEAQAGEEVISMHDRHRPNLTLDEAAAEATFAVWAVAELPEGVWRTRTHLHRDRNRGERIGILYHRADGRGAIQLHEHATGAELPWTRSSETAAVVTERNGTTITLQSQDYDEETLRGLAETLVRV